MATSWKREDIGSPTAKSNTTQPTTADRQAFRVSLVVMARVLRLPDHGRLLVCTDLQGCLRDFRRMVDLFDEARARHRGDAHLMFTGDLIHGPHLEEDEWPDFL